LPILSRTPLYLLPGEPPAAAAVRVWLPLPRSNSPPSPTSAAVRADPLPGSLPLANRRARGPGGATPPLPLRIGGRRRHHPHLSPPRFASGGNSEGEGGTAEATARVSALQGGAVTPSPRASSTREP
ncbi:unnamed protein product, partial [Urochloa humidicola]